ncbi:MAG: hypothetical protein COA73_16290 [Candidatus Hydrogenedentota bacterium]|nr:MAG: hypothetical protein COA73_16290 [Candidatus Hydrogenedentota bacterium]
MTETKKEHFRQELRKYCSQNGVDFDGLDNIRRSNFMTKFYVGEILSSISNQLAPSDEDEIEDHIVDGANDMGVDFIFRIGQRVLVIQTKYQGKKSNAKENVGEVTRFYALLKRLYAAIESDSIKHENLRDIVSEIDWDNDSFDLHYISLGKRNCEIERLEESGQEPINGLDDIEDRVSIRYLDESDLNQQLRTARQFEDVIKESIDLRLTRTKGEPAWITYVASDSRTSYTGRIAGNQLYDLVSRYRERLFSLNIRNYIGDNRTNKKIIKTATDEAEKFYFYNNGISAIATEIVEDAKNGVLQCKNLSIINGAQTANSIHKAFKKDKSRKASETSVLIRISEINYKKDNKEHGFLDKITQYNNTQNSIKLSDFRSNDNIQLELRNRFKKMNHRGKKFHYMNKRQKTKSNHFGIRMEEFTKFLHSFQFGPVDFYGGINYLFDSGVDGGYRKLFGDGESLVDEDGNDTFDFLAGMWFLCMEIKSSISISRKKRQEIESEKEVLSLEKKALNGNIVFYVFGEILRLKSSEEEGNLYEQTIRKLSDPKWLDDETKLGCVQQYTEFAVEVLVRNYLQAMDKEDFIHRNYFRERNTLLKIQNDIKISKTAYKSLETF